MSFHTVTVVGVGLIGGSFGLALKKAGFAGRILGVSSPATIEAALAKGAIDAGATFEEGVGEADLVYLAQPILRILEQTPAVAQAAKPGALITDAGSTKAAICAKAEQCLPDGVLFVGGHPMAGKEGRGVGIAEAELFEGAAYVVTPSPAAAGDPRYATLIDLIRSIGARPRRMDSHQHDRVVACTSHLPQIVSSALAASVVAQLASDADVAVAGGGLRDMTRLAESSFEMWEGIFATNRQSILESLTEYVTELNRFRADLENSTLKERFDAAKSARATIDRRGDFRDTG